MSAGPPYIKLPSLGKTFKINLPTRVGTKISNWEDIMCLLDTLKHKTNGYCVPDTVPNAVYILSFNTEGKIEARRC